MFQAVAEWLDRRRALRDLSAPGWTFAGGQDKAAEEKLDQARAAAGRGDVEVARSIWRDLRGTLAGPVRGSAAVIDLLIDLDLLDEAEAIAWDGRRRHPRQPRFAIAAARVAHRRGDATETLRRCELLRRAFPRVSEGYTIAARCLTTLGRGAEADAILRRGARKLPRDIEMQAEYARHAERTSDWPEALRRWEKANARFDNCLCRSGIAQSLRASRRYEEAAAVASETTERYPDDPWAFAELGHIAAAAGQLDQASRQWAETRRRFPFFVHAFTEGAALAARMGRMDEADAILTQAVDRFRWNRDLHLTWLRHARTSEARAERTAAVRRRFPQQDVPISEPVHAVVTSE